MFYRQLEEILEKQRLLEFNNNNAKHRASSVKDMLVATSYNALTVSNVKESNLINVALQIMTMEFCNFGNPTWKGRERMFWKLEGSYSEAAAQNQKELDFLFCLSPIRHPIWHFPKSGWQRTITTARSQESSTQFCSYRLWEGKLLLEWVPSWSVTSANTENNGNVLSW